MTVNSAAPIILTASDLRRWEHCRREYLLWRDWRPIRWGAKALFDSCLRGGILALSIPTPTATVVADARERFLREAANPGLDLAPGADSWTVAQDWAGMLGVVLTAISRAPLSPLSRPTPAPLERSTSTLESLSWLPLSFVDPRGTLHRWITCDSWDAGELVRQGHSWHTLGDMAVLDAPMTIHAVEIGRQRSSRRQSPWARTWKHPIIAGEYRFQRPDGKGGWRKLAGQKWTPVWFADQHSLDEDAWCDLMDADHVTPALLQEQSIAGLGRQQASRLRAEILSVSQEIGRVSQGLPAGAEKAMSLPPQRSACDPPQGPCVWQAACWAREPGPVADAGLYQIRAADASAPRSSVTPVSAPSGGVASTLPIVVA